MTRRIFRTPTTGVHFIKDKVAGFGLPALHVDLGLEGLLTIRGWTLSLSTLTIELHGIEAAYNLSEEMHVALYCDSFAIRLCRGVSTGPIHSVLKREKFIIQLGDLASTLEERRMYEGPPEKSSTRAQNLIDHSDECHDKEADLRTPGKLSRDSMAQSEYDKIRRKIHTTSPIQQCRERTEAQTPPQLEQKTRAATCEKLEQVPSVPHRSRRCIKASTILELIPSWLRQLFSRMPLLLRLILMPTTYLHPVSVESASISASGSWMASMMQDAVHSVYSDDRDDIKQLEQTAFDWMDNAFFCMDLSEIQTLVRISTRKSQNMESSIRCGSSMVMRIDSDTNTVAPAMSIDGADANFTIPSFFLPSHEHLLPPRPDVRAEDQANIGFAAHLTFPAVLDRAMVDFFADLVESLIVMEIDDHEEKGCGDDAMQSKMDRVKNKFQVGVHETGRSIKKGLKKAAFKSRGDSQIAWAVEILRGDVGYAGDMPVSLAFFRGSELASTKLFA
ncbi:unnamed protein product [Zymoseptoria tritici ST99CH_3D1]|nr:unnamed protein product [Zymoseptoria tritici ST99CH_3D1]